MGIPVDFPTIVETYGIVTPPQRRPFEGRSESAISDQMSLMLVPAEVNEYFDAVPMNWATVMPLFDRQERTQ